VYHGGGIVTTARRDALLAAAAVAALGVYALVTRARYLLGDPYPLGVDGYFYAVQVRSLVETGHLNYPAAPLGFWWMAPFARVFGVIDGIKLAAAAGTAAAVWPAYALARRVAGGDRAAGVLGAALVATSASSFFLATEFVKQGLGLTLALAHLAALGAALERPTRARVAAAAAWLVAAWLTHKSAAAVAIVCGAPALLVELRARAPERFWPVVAAGAAVVVAVFVAGAFAPGLPGPRDLRHAATLFCGETDWELPALAHGRVRLTFDHEVAIGAALAAAAIALAATAPRGERRLPALAIGPAALAIALAIPWLDPHDPLAAVFRLRLIAFVPLAPLAAFVLVHVAAAARVPADARALVALGAALGLLVARPTARSEGVQPAHPALVTAVRALDGAVPEGVTVVTDDRQVAFMARWYARVPTRLRPPRPPDPAHTYRLIAGGLMTPELATALDELRRERPPGVPPTLDLHPFEANGLVLMPEATFEWLLARLPPAARATWTAWTTT
jgi:hypothetical protein